MATSVNTLGRAWGAGWTPPSMNPKHADGPGEREPDQCPIGHSGRRTVAGAPNTSRTATTKDPTLDEASDQ